MQEGFKNRGELGHPAEDELPRWSWSRPCSTGLKIRRALTLITPDCIGTCGQCMPVRNGEETPKVTRRRAPAEPEVIARQSHRHRPHARIDPARCNERPHAGIHKGQTPLGAQPGLERSDAMLAADVVENRDDLAQTDDEALVVRPREFLSAFLKIRKLAA